MLRVPWDMMSGTIHESNNYGEFTILEYINSKAVVIEFVSTGYSTTTRATHIRSGKVKDLLLPTVYGVGYIGVGIHNSHKGTGPYTTWYNMLRRCYSGEYSSYIGCVVCSEWHNFQKFAEWFYINHIEGYQLDKDIVGDSTIYSPSTCIFVSAEVNSMAATGTLGTSWVLIELSTGRELTIQNQNAFCKAQGLVNQGLNALCVGKIKTSQGYRLKGVVNNAI